MAAIVLLLLQLLSFALFARAVLSWFNIGPTSGFFPLWNALRRGTEPILAPLRRLLPPIGGLDLSILAAIVAINVVGIPIASRL